MFNAGGSVQFLFAAVLLTLAGTGAGGCGVRSVLSAEADQAVTTSVDGGGSSDKSDAGKGNGGDGDGDGSNAGWDAGEGRPCGLGGECNPDNLGGATCATLELGTGKLACDEGSCTFDTSMCSGDMPNGGAGTPALFGGGLLGGGDAGALFGGGATDGGLFGGFGGGQAGGGGQNAGGGFIGGGQNAGGGLIGGGQNAGGGAQNNGGANPPQ